MRRSDQRYSRNKGSSNSLEPLSPRVSRRLMKLVGYASERIAELGAEAVDDRDNRYRDASRDKAILNGGCSRIVFQETRNKLVHDEAPGRRKIPILIGN